MKQTANHLYFKCFLWMTLIFCLSSTSLNAQNLSAPEFYQNEEHGGRYEQHGSRFSNYRSLSSSNYPRYQEPRRASGNLNQKLYENLSSNETHALVSYETVSENNDTASEELIPEQNSFSCSTGGCYSECDPQFDFTLKEDIHNFFPMLWEDSKQLINWKNGLYLGVALGGSLALRDSVDDKVRENTARHPVRWGRFSQAMEDVGSVEYQIPVVLGIYSYSLYKDNPKLHSFSNSLISAMTINGLATISIKAIADTDRPSLDYNDGEMGFPSYHTSSMFTIASVVDEYYGHAYGFTAYTFAGLVGWTRIDQRHHDLSDVVFGAALGTIIGKGVAQFHRSRECNYRLAPYIHPTSGTTGMMVDIRF